MMQAELWEWQGEAHLKSGSRAAQEVDYQWPGRGLELALSLKGMSWQGGSANGCGGKGALRSLLPQSLGNILMVSVAGRGKGEPRAPTCFPLSSVTEACFMQQAPALVPCQTRRGN